MENQAMQYNKQKSNQVIDNLQLSQENSTNFFLQNTIEPFDYSVHQNQQQIQQQQNASQHHQDVIEKADASPSQFLEQNNNDQDQKMEEEDEEEIQKEQIKTQKQNIQNNETTNEQQNNEKNNDDLNDSNFKNINEEEEQKIQNNQNNQENQMQIEQEKCVQKNLLQNIIIQNQLNFSTEDAQLLKLQQLQQQQIQQQEIQLQKNQQQQYFNKQQNQQSTKGETKIFPLQSEDIIIIKSKKDKIDNSSKNLINLNNNKIFNEFQSTNRGGAYSKDEHGDNVQISSMGVAENNISLINLNKQQQLQQQSEFSEKDEAEQQQQQQQQQQQSQQLQQYEQISGSEKKNPLINFFNNYSMFVSETSNIILDLDIVLNKLMDATKKLKPPSNSSEDTLRLWSYLLDIDKSSLNSLADRLKKMPDNKLYDQVQNLEKLYIKLMIEYNLEVQRGKRLGIIKNENIKNLNELQQQ